MSTTFIATVLLCCAGASTALGAVLRVPADHRTIPAAVEAAAAGDTVRVDPGTYAERVRLKPGVVLKSAGDDKPGKFGLARAEATVIDGQEKTDGGPAVVLAEGAVLDGFTVTRVGKFDQAEYDKHHAAHGEDLPDDRGAVGTGRDVPAVSVSAVTAVVRNCIVRDNGQAGIAVVSAPGKRNASRIAGNSCFRNMGGGIGVAQGAVPLVEKNRCWNNLRSGIGNRASAGLIIGNECFDNVRAGIGIREGARPIVRGNTCYRNRRAGIGCRMKGTAPLIEDNDCYENSFAGVGCRDGAEPFIRNNRCRENGLAGIGARDGAEPTIFGNKCSRNKEAGIGVQGGAVAFIAHNECWENEKAGIGQRGDSRTILGGNHLHHNREAGIGFEDAKAGRSVVLNNKVIDNGKVAVGIHGGWIVRLAGNELSRAEGLPPLVMVFKGAQAEFSDNVFRGSGVAAVRSEGVVRAVNNRFECPAPRDAGPPQSAVWALPDSETVFAGNVVDGWRHALTSERAAVTFVNNRVAGFRRTAVLVSRPAGAALITGNLFTGPANSEPVSLTGGVGIVEDNRTAAPAEGK
jgi:hypothetical protein